MDIGIIKIPEINLKWNKWYKWHTLELDLRRSDNGVNVPSRPGVYEARYEDEEECLTIGTVIPDVLTEPRDLAVARAES